VVEALQAHSAYNTASLDAPIGAGGATVADLHGDLDTALEQAAYRKELRDTLHELPVRDRRILLLRFFGDKTQTQIADELGVSQMQVSRLLSRSLAVLRRRMGAE
jgi:RNA polymerase sigma-B factor